MALGGGGGKKGGRGENGEEREKGGRERISPLPLILPRHLQKGGGKKGEGRRGKKKKE